MDLEMHIVHKIQKEMNPTKVGKDAPQASQFVGAVLGFIFKVMPDSFFDEKKKENPSILYHDEFLMNLVDEEKHRQMVMEEQFSDDEELTPQVANTD